MTYGNILSILLFSPFSDFSSSVQQGSNLEASLVWFKHTTCEEGDRRVYKVYGVVAALIKYKCIVTIFLSSLEKATGTETLNSNPGLLITKH